MNYDEFETQAFPSLEINPEIEGNSVDLNDRKEIRFHESTNDSESTNSDTTDIDDIMVVVEDETQYFSCQEAPTTIISAQIPHFNGIVEDKSEVSEDLAAEVNYIASDDETISSGVSTTDNIADKLPNLPLSPNKCTSGILTFSTKTDEYLTSVTESSQGDVSVSHPCEEVDVKVIVIESDQMVQSSSEAEGLSSESMDGSKSSTIQGLFESIDTEDPGPSIIVSDISQPLLKNVDQVFLSYSGLNQAEQEELKNLCTILNWIIVDNVSQASYLIVPTTIKRTPKFMIALNIGLSHIVHMQWLRDSAVEGSALVLNIDNANRYVPCDSEKEKLYEFRLLDTLSMKREGKLFQGISFYICQGVCGSGAAPEQDDMRRIIESGGGKVYFADFFKGKRKTSITTVIESINSVIVVALKGNLNDQEIDLVDRGYVKGKAFLPEFIFTAVMRQRIDRTVGVLSLPAKDDLTDVKTKQKAKRKRL